MANKRTNKTKIGKFNKSSGFSLPNKKSVILLIVVAALAAGLIYLASWVIVYKNAIDQAGTGPIRNLILQAIDNLGDRAPIDPRTGDTYLPQARTYLPYEPNTPSPKLIYVVINDEAQGTELYVTEKTVVDNQKTKLYIAKNTEELFEAVPKLQACQRGIKLLFAPANSDYGYGELDQTVELADGRTLYMYADDDCPELAYTLEALKNLKSY